ncbi:hypothetical protein DPMN_112509 [Dreissena polymorpha]|uniref:Uncharacterized protein n=1 Tax=Dreissena polymorpha TaxID=45954 RepID=A0A9D4QQQ0_DREPO|nr:hypothetical protein DPMN_112509 [Dreissena polymorpha]
MAEDMTLSPLAETVVKVFVERFESDDSGLQADYVVETTEHVKERPLQMASTFVNINQPLPCVIRLLNPFTTNVILRQEAVIDSAKKIRRVVSVLSSKKMTKKEAIFLRYAEV